MNIVDAFRSLAAVADPIVIIPELATPAAPQGGPQEEAVLPTAQAALFEKFKEFASPEAAARAHEFLGVAQTHAQEVSERVTQVINRELSRLPIPESVDGQEDVSSAILRNAAANAARVGEAVVGAPGDFVSDIDAVFEIADQYELPENVQIALNDAQKFKKEHIPHLPTSSELRESGKQLTGGYLEPRTAAEEHVQEFTSRVATELNPLLTGKKPKVLKTVKAVAIDLGVEHVAEKLGVKESVTSAFNTLRSFCPPLPFLKKKPQEED